MQPDIYTNPKAHYYIIIIIIILLLLLIMYIAVMPVGDAGCCE